MRKCLACPIGSITVLVCRLGGTYVVHVVYKNCISIIMSIDDIHKYYIYTSRLPLLALLVSQLFIDIAA